LFNAISAYYVLNLANSKWFSANKKIKVDGSGFYTSEFYDTFPYKDAEFAEVVVIV